jgi:radical SAM protein with 4Fe4S-binding SPASM domain
MKEISLGRFYDNIVGKKRWHPVSGQVDLTYFCGLNCVHCYCKGLEDKDKELSTVEWKKVLDEIHEAGCLYLCFSGGDPLIKKDFLELYSYAKNKGFIISLFSNGLLFTDVVIKHLVKSQPYSIEITLNAITKAVYERITQTEGSFERVMGNVKKIARSGLPLVIKSNCLKQNRRQIHKIKAFTEKLLGKPKNKHLFHYDPMIYPRLNGDKTPCGYRLSYNELVELKKQDKDMWQEYEKGLHNTDLSEETRGADFLYRCDSWQQHFFINPYGRLKFCMFTNKFSIDLKTTPFKEGFYRIFPMVLQEKFKTSSKCKGCKLRTVCYHCPARAYLETGDEEAPISSYCELAKLAFEDITASQS